VPRPLFPHRARPAAIRTSSRNEKCAGAFSAGASAYKLRDDQVVPILTYIRDAAASVDAEMCARRARLGRAQRLDQDRLGMTMDE